MKQVFVGIEFRINYIKLESTIEKLYSRVINSNTVDFGNKNKKYFLCLALNLKP